MHPKTLCVPHLSMLTKTRIFTQHPQCLFKTSQCLTPSSRWRYHPRWLGSNDVCWRPKCLVNACDIPNVIYKVYPINMLVELGLKMSYQNSSETPSLPYYHIVSQVLWHLSSMYNHPKVSRLHRLTLLLSLSHCTQLSGLN